jgi:hypothetical protein
MTGNEVAAYLVTHDGGTFSAEDLEPYEPSNGYAVGMAQGNAAVLPLTASPSRLVATMRRVAQEYEANFVGLWVDGDNIVVDPVRILTHFVSAIGAAERYGQRAIFGFAEGLVIEVS